VGESHVNGFEAVVGIDVPIVGILGGFVGFKLLGIGRGGARLWWEVSLLKH
jgi:hypothetical protein